MTDETPTNDNSVSTRYTEAMEAAELPTRPFINRMFYAHFEEMAKLRSDLVRERMEAAKYAADVQRVFFESNKDFGRVVAERDKLISLIWDLTDSEPCRLDHHGGCQEHGYLGLEPAKRCPHAEAKELLASMGIELEG